MLPDRRPTSIRSVRVARLDIPLKEPFGISGGALAVAANVLVAVELEDGTIGHGEASPFPAYNGETQAEALRLLSGASGWLTGRDAAQWGAIASDFRGHAAGAACGSAVCALETALLDALALRERVPLWRFFGGAGTELETDMTVTTGTPAQAGAAALAIRRRGFRIIKVKVGGPGGPRADIERISAVLEAAPGAPLVLDANAGLDRRGSSELLALLKGRGISPLLIEQWLAAEDLGGLRALRAESGWPVALDESVATEADARRAAAAGAADVINVKLMKAGIGEAMRVAGVAREAGIGLMIGGNVESVLAMTTSACFAAGLGGFSHADLDTPLFLAENPFRGGYLMEGGRISVAHIVAGHGVVPLGLLL